MADRRLERQPAGLAKRADGAQPLVARPLVARPLVAQPLVARPLGVVLAALALLPIAPGCGPSLYTFNIVPASQAVEQAGQANAAEHAPYEYFAAREYLAKAREEAAEANYQDAIRFAERANEYGEQARDAARERMREQGR